MATPAIYGLCLLLCCGYALAAGGAPERWVAAIMLLGSLLSPMVVRGSTHFVQVEWRVFAIDVVDQILLLAVAAKADRFWPIAVAGVHLMSPLTHVTKATIGYVEPRAYAIAQAAASYLILLLMAIGTARHQGRKRRFGTDASWSASCVTSPPRASPLG